MTGNRHELSGDISDFTGPWKRVGDQWDLYEFTTAIRRFKKHSKEVYRIE
jgi:hypothetical protein